MTKRLTLAFLFVAWLASAQTGVAVGELQPLDRAMTALMEKWGFPGGSLAVVNDGKLVYARGFGLADRVNGRPVQPDSLFRICSLSKSVTATAVLALVEDGRLSLDTPVLEILGPEIAPPELLQDVRWGEITVRHLLHHAGGWDANQTFEPMALTAQDIRDFGGDFPLTLNQIISYMLTQPLQFEPGTRAAYSNFGYALLGPIIERASGMLYEQYVRERVWNRIGITRPYLSGGPVTARRPGEVEYYDFPGAPLGEAVYPGVGQQVAFPDGVIFHEPLAAAGGWVASAPDFVRYMRSLLTSEALLRSSSRQIMFTPPSFANPADPLQPGIGWIVLPLGDQRVLLADGQASGSYAFAGWSSAANTGFVALFNSSPPDAGLRQLFDDVFGALAAALGAVERWPATDLFASYYPNAPRIADGGVANTASYLSSKVASGELMSVYGDHLGPREAVRSSFDAQGRLTSELAGVSVTFNGLPAPILYASTERIDVVTPSRLAEAGKVAIEVVYQGRKSASLDVELDRPTPGLFTVSTNGRGYVVAVNSDGTLNSEETPARKGDWIALFGTGLGTPETGLDDGAMVRQARHRANHGIRVRIDGIESEVLYAGGSPGSIAGLWQLNVRVPDGASSGMKPIQAEVEGRHGREPVYLQVE